MSDPHEGYVEPSVLTMVSVFLGDCRGDSLPLVCEGTSTSVDATMWQRVGRALQRPIPRGPYPVAGVFTVFVHDTSLSDSRVLSTSRIDVVCRGGLAYASVETMRVRIDRETVPVVIGDDVVTIARKIGASVE